MSYAQYAPTAIAAAQAFGIDPRVMLAQITQESSWNPSAISPAGARGIAQFMPATAAGLGINPDNPEEALYGMAAHMSQLLGMFGGDYSLALAAYNAGPGAVQQYGGIPPYAETQSYVQKILGGDGGGAMPEMGFPDWWPDWLGGGDDEPQPEGFNPNDEDTWTGDRRVNFLGGAGFTHISGEGENALWRAIDGRTMTEEQAFTLMLGERDENGDRQAMWAEPPKPPAGSNPAGFTLSPGQTRYGPDGRLVASSPTNTAAQSGFTLSPGQARFDATGKQIASYPGAAKTPEAFTLGSGQTRYVPDPTAPGGYRAITAGDAMAGMAEQWKKDYAVATTLDNFLQNKFAFENSQGLTEAAAKTQQQIFDNKQKMATYQRGIDEFNARMLFDVQQANIANEEKRQGRLSDLATQIGTLAQDPGDRAKYASTVLANSGMAFGQDRATGDMRTSDSLMPLESLLRQRSDLMGQQPQVNVPPVSGINLAGLQAPTANPAALPQPQMPDTTPGYDTGTGQPGIPYGGIALDPEEIMAGAQYADTPGNYGGTQPLNLAALMGALPQQQQAQAIIGPDNELPMKRHGGMEDEAFIAGESGPEIVIPKADGKAVILNAEQAKVAGIDLSKLQKFADGGLFDGLIKDNDRGMATSFLNEATTRALSGTPWAGGSIPSPTFASSPGFDPIVAQLMASINAMQTGVPAASYLRNAALRRPAGVNEAPIRRSA